MVTSKKEVHAAFKRLLYAMDKNEAKSYSDVGGYVLDYASIYGGPLGRNVGQPSI